MSKNQEVINIPEIDLASLSFSKVFDFKKILKFQEILLSSTGVKSHINALQYVQSENHLNIISTLSSLQEENITDTAASFCPNIQFNNPFRPIVYSCFETHLLRADIYMMISDKPLAIWTIAQSESNCPNALHNESLGVNGQYNEATEMRTKSFQNVAQLVYEYVNELSEKKYTNLLLKAEIEENEKALKVKLKNEQRLSFALEATTDAIWEWDYTTGEVTYSKRWFEMLGYNVGELGTKFDDWVEICHPDDYQPTVDQVLEVLGEPESSGYAVEFRVLCKDGTWKWILGRGNVVIRDENQKPLLLSGTNTDISERKQSELLLLESEEKLNTLFNSMKEMVVLHEVIFNTDGEAINYKIIDCNKSYTKVTGISREDAIGKLATEVYQSDVAPYLHEFTQVGITGKPYEYTTYYSPMDKHFSISVVCPKRNTFATITNDITAIIQIQEVIKSKNKELENYLYVASHDLRSPLVNIQGFSQRLQKQTNKLKQLIPYNKLDRDVKEEIDKIINAGVPNTIEFIFSNVTKMDGLINGLLKLSRTGRITMDIQKIDMSQLIQNILSNHNFQIVEVSAQIKVDQLIDCYGDQNQLSQLFSNLIENAIKYCDSSRQLVIEITSQTHYKKVIYKLKDNGIGISQRYINKIWDVFYRVNPNSDKIGEGLGLSLTRRIAEKHHGKIWVESQEGIGSTFYVELQKNKFTE